MDCHVKSGGASSCSMQCNNRCKSMMAVRKILSSVSLQEDDDAKLSDMIFFGSDVTVLVMKQGDRDNDDATTATLPRSLPVFAGA